MQLDAIAALVVASTVLGSAATLLLFRATMLRRLEHRVADTVKAAGDATLKAAHEAMQRDVQAATDAITALRSERGRVMALLRHRGRPTADAEDDGDEDDGDEDGQPDRLDQLLANPVVQGFMQAKGIDPSMLGALANGDPAALMVLQQRAAAPAAAQDGGLLG